MTPERANEIIDTWQLVSEGERATPELVFALTGATWPEWELAHRIVYGETVPDLGFA